MPFLWRLHAVHSVKTKDWVASSRQHAATDGARVHAGTAVHRRLLRVGVNRYILIVASGRWFNRANVHLPWGPLKDLMATPDFPLWHASDEEAIDSRLCGVLRFP